jgi:hypothetical protein
MMAVRAGAQTGAQDHARVKSIPCAAKASTFGVRAKLVAVTAHFDPVILAGQPEDIRLLLSLLGEGDGSTGRTAIVA